MLPLLVTLLNMLVLAESASPVFVKLDNIEVSLMCIVPPLVTSLGTLLDAAALTITLSSDIVPPLFSIALRLLSKIT